MRNSILVALTALAALLLVGAPVASAAPLSSADGAPNDNDSSPRGYYIFHNDDVFRLHTHGPGEAHDFDAVLHTEGIFDNVSPMRLEDGDRADVTDGGHTLVLHFHTYNATDGADFRVRGSENLHLDLKLDGRPISTDSIFLGPQGRHPKHNPFNLHA